MRVRVLGFSSIGVRVEVGVQVWIAAHLGSRSRRQAGGTGLGGSGFSVGSGSGVVLDLLGLEVLFGSVPGAALLAWIQGSDKGVFPKWLISVRSSVNKFGKPTENSSKSGLRLTARKVPFTQLTGEFR